MVMPEEKLKKMTRTYSELMQLESFEERFEYLKLCGVVGESTFGSDRYLNQIFYNNPDWKAIRNQVIIRDNGCDLGCEDHPVYGQILIHHMNPITKDDILNRSSNLYDLNNLICVSNNTHQAIHYGDADLLPKKIVERRPNDTCPWKQ